MKSSFLFLFAAILALPAGAGAQVAFRTTADSVSYGAGLTVGGHIRNEALANEVDFDTRIVRRAIEHSLASEDNDLLAEQRSFIRFYHHYVDYRLPGQRLEEAEAFLEKLQAENPDVKKSESGLVYQIFAPGDDTRADYNDKMVVNEKGELLGGRVIELNDSVTFPVNGVVEGYAEGVHMVGVGGRIKMWIHPDLAYGMSGARWNKIVPSNALLVYEVEVLQIIPVEEQEQAQSSLEFVEYPDPEDEDYVWVRGKKKEIKKSYTDRDGAVWKKVATPPGVDYVYDSRARKWKKIKYEPGGPATDVDYFGGIEDVLTAELLSKFVLHTYTELAMELIPDVDPRATVKRMLLEQYPGAFEAENPREALLEAMKLDVEKKILLDTLGTPAFTTEELEKCYRDIIDYGFEYSGVVVAATEPEQRFVAVAEAITQEAANRIVARSVKKTFERSAYEAIVRKAFDDSIEKASQDYAARAVREYNAIMHSVSYMTVFGLAIEELESRPVAAPGSLSLVGVTDSLSWAMGLMGAANISKLVREDIDVDMGIFFAAMEYVYGLDEGEYAKTWEERHVWGSFIEDFLDERFPAILRRKTLDSLARFEAGNPDVMRADEGLLYRVVTSGDSVRPGDGDMVIALLKNVTQGVGAEPEKPDVMIAVKMAGGEKLAGVLGSVGVGAKVCLWAEEEEWPRIGSLGAYELTTLKIIPPAAEQQQKQHSPTRYQLDDREELIKRPDGYDGRSSWIRVKKVAAKNSYVDYEGYVWKKSEKK